MAVRQPESAAPPPPIKVTGDDQQIVLTTGDDQPSPGQAHVYRVTATQGQVFGGYTVVLLGPPAP